MASVADAIYGTDVFGQQDAITMTSISEGVDVIARPDFSAYEIPITPRSHHFLLDVGGKPIRFTYTAPDGRLPLWVRSVLQSLPARCGVRRGWDSYGAAPTDPTLVVQLLTILLSVMEDSSKPPQLTPLADGGMQAEWHGTSDLEIVVPSKESPTYYFFDHTSNAEEEDIIRDHYDRVRQLVEKHA